MSIIMTWGRLRPPSMRNSTTLSRMPESELPSWVMGRIFEISSALKSADSMSASRERIQLTLPRSVLISPLWASVAEGVRERPGGQRVRREAAVDEGEGRFEGLVAQVRRSRPAPGRGVSMPL